ncbi:hypothetical protein MMC25_006570 [Agyrium rufum]|nr:hypothetical protein [Agyrium rufum]
MSDTTSTRPGRRLNDSSNTSEESYGSSLIGPSSSPTSPGSPRPKRIRRTKGIEEKSSIQKFIGGTENEELRTGLPRLCRLPVAERSLNRQHPLRQNWTDGANLEKLVTFLANKYSIERGPALFDRKFKFAADEEYVPTLLFFSRETQSTASWPAFCQELDSGLKARGFQDVYIEVADIEALRPIYYTAAGPHKISRCWSDLLTNIEKFLEAKPWKAIEVFRRGKEKIPEKNPVVVTITIDDETNYDWTPQRELVLERLAQLELEGVDVVFERSNITLSSPQSNRGLYTVDEVPHLDFFSQRAQIGESLGTSTGRHTVGTLGCYLRLTLPNGGLKRMALTNYHVIMQPSDNNPGWQRWEQLGIFPADPARPTMSQPAIPDRQWVIERWNEDIAKQQEWLRTTSMPTALRINHQAEIDALQTLVNNAPNHQGNLGIVFAASGLTARKLDGRFSNLLDWALIDILSDRHGNNELPLGSAMPTRKMRFAWKIVVPTVIRGIVPREEIQGLETVFKIGRSSGITMGVFESWRECALKSWRYEGENWVQSTTRECNVTTQATVDGFAFGAGGDSGAAVLTPDGRWVGLYFGGCEERKVGYFTPAMDVIKDIKRITGATHVDLD